MRIQFVQKQIRPRCQEWFLFLRWLAIFLAALARLIHAGNFYTNISPLNVPWPGGVVPYEFTNTLTAAQTNTYLAALREWQLAAKVSFVPHTNQTHWVLFAYNTNWIDNVSAGTNPQVVTISSLSRAQVCHEMGHSFGFTHENIRTDQANYLTVLTNNISNEPSNIVFFTIDPGSVTNGPYDFESVMHLSWDFASSNPGVLATQRPKPPYFPRHQFRMGNFCLSPGDRAALAYLYGPPAVPLTNIVTTTADFGPGSLRAAMYYAADHPGTSVKFNIPVSDPGYSNGVFNIHLTGMLPPLAANGMVIDGSTQPGFTREPLIVVDASQIIPETYTSDTFLIYSASNQIRNLSFSGFNWNGLTLELADATNNTIAGCWLGVDATGSNAAPNAYQGILLASGASGNIIGGTNALAGNVVSGNLRYGIFITDSNTTGNVVLGNLIGTDANGGSALANGLSGVFIGSGADGNIIGGTNAGAGNILSGNVQYGLYLGGTMNNAILCNYIGTDVSGSNAVPNQFSGLILAGNSGSNVVAGNLVSGNVNAGLWLTGTGTFGNTVQGNWAGLNAAGSSALPNTFIGMYLLGGAQSNLVVNNVFSGNFSEGLRIADPGTSGNVVQGNYFGTDATGMNSVPNGFAGATIFNGATSNLIGGVTAGARNIISGNGSYGFVVGDPGTSGNLVEGNFIGLAPDGLTPVPNFHGVLISNGATNNILGGTANAARNVISGNYGSGIFLTDPGTSGNFIQGDYIGPDASGASAAANGFEGIYVVSGASGNFIGGAVAGAGNVISGNTLRGIYAYGTNTSGNWIQGNFIGLAADGTNALGNGWDGVVFFDGASSNVVGLTTSGAGAGNRIEFNGYTGVYVGNDITNFSVGNTIRGNVIFSNNEIGINLAGGSEDSFGVTANHPGGAMPGPNNLQNYPVITNAAANGATTTISGTLNSSPNRMFLIDVYCNATPDPSGHGQGQIYVGTATATTDDSSNATFSLTVSGNFSGQYFSATATDQSSGDTSEFSADVPTTNVTMPSAQFGTPFTWNTGGFIFNLTLTTNFSYRIQATTNLAVNPIPWVDLTNFIATSSPLAFTDRTATNFSTRFYRVVSP